MLHFVKVKVSYLFTNLFLSYLRDNLKFIDPSRICAYGWGYGGYATVMTLIDDSQQVLQCGVAVNPIASFGYHCKFYFIAFFLFCQ